MAYQQRACNKQELVCKSSHYFRFGGPSVGVAGAEMWDSKPESRVGNDLPYR